MSLVFFSQIFFEKDSFARKVAPVVSLIVYAFAGAAVFELLEGSGPCPYGYWQSLWFVNTVVTTIGYGRTHACTWGGKLFTCIYALLAVPLAVTALNRIGDLLVQPLHYLYKHLQSDPKKKVKQHESHETPMLLALLVTVAWLFATAGYFCYTSSHSASVYQPDGSWGFPNSLYYVFISVATIGFGDHVPTDYQLTALHYSFLMIGLSLFSMCFKLVQQKISHFGKVASEQIFHLYKEALQNDKQMGVNMGSVLKNLGGGKVFSKLMSQQMVDSLTTELNTLSNRISKSTQTDPETNVSTHTTQTPKCIVKLTTVQTANSSSQTTKYFRVKADWHTSPSFDLD